LPHFAQYRFSSGTSARDMTAVAGSACTIGVTSTRPPPKRRRRDPVRELPVRPLDPVRVESAPVRDEGDVAAVPAVRCRGVVALAAATGAGAAAAPAAGAIPQVSQ
jgi:hypothetical protein